MIICDHPEGFNPLLGRNSLDVLVPDWRIAFCSVSKQVNHVLSGIVPFSVDDLKSLFPKAFDVNSDTCIVGFMARLVLKPNAIPVFAKPYHLAFGLE